MITADNITDEQIRELRIDGEIDFKTYHQAVIPYADKWEPGCRSKARARCAEILNQRSGQGGQVNFLDKALPRRFWGKCMPEPMSGCWLWIGASNKTDYGVFRYVNGAHLAHRVALGHVEPLDAALVVDHKCRNTRCVNPAHLRQVTQQTNTQVNYRSTRTHCANGHEFTPENTYRHAGGRKCRRCHADKQAARKERLNARAASGGAK